MERRSGFTLVEILLASVIGAFIALVAVGALRAVSASAEMLDKNISTSSEARFAAQIIARDLMNLYRAQDPSETKLIGMADKRSEGTVSYLCFYTVGRTKARIDQPEGDVYEVEYSLHVGGEKRALKRRLWPNPDKEAIPGGIMTAIAEDIDIFQVRYYDGERWAIEWPEELRTLPELVEVTIQASGESRADVALESFIVGFPRPPWRRGGGSAGTTGEGAGD
jgi:type II secretion system protein J